MSDNSNKIILDLCGGTGAWSRPYKENGYDVRLITLPDNDVLTYEPPEGVYGILAAPPCTEFSLAKGNKPRDFENAVKILAACMQVIWTCRIFGSLQFWAMENPKGFMRQFMGAPAYTFEHWQFGHLQIKPTDLWGYFNAPEPIVRIKPAELAIPDCPAEYKHLNLSRAALRAITPAGFAQAFYKANR